MSVYESRRKDAAAQFAADVKELREFTGIETDRIYRWYGAVRDEEKAA